MTSLSAQGPVADLLSRTPPAAVNAFGTLQKLKFERRLLEAASRATHQQKTLQWVLSGLHPYAAMPRQDLNPAYLDDIRRFAFGSRALDWGVPLRRKHLVDRGIFPSSVPPAGVDPGLLQLCDAFDNDLMGGIHPIVRSALGGYSFMRLRPYGQADRPMSGLVFTLLLCQAGWPPLPLALLLHRRRDNVLRTMAASLIAKEPDQCVALAIDLTEEAIALGRRMVDELDRQRRLLRSCLGTSGGWNDDVVDAILAAPILEPLTFVTNATLQTRLIDDFMAPLHATGLVDLIEVRDRKWWAVPAIQRLLTA